MDTQNGAILSDRENSGFSSKPNVKVNSINGLLKPIQVLTEDMVERDDIAEDLINQEIKEIGLETWDKLDFQTEMKIWDLAYKEARFIQGKLAEMGAQPWEDWSFETRVEFRSRTYMEKVMALVKSSMEAQGETVPEK